MADDKKDSWADFEDQLERMPGWSRKDLRELQDKMKQSAMFLGLIPDDEGYFNDIRMVLQIGYAVLHDKPMYFVVKQGTKMPETLRKLASGIEEFKAPDDFEFAVKKLMKPILEHEKEEKDKHA
jgi:hypothetical protein